MKSIYTVAKITIAEFSVYRINFLVWRFRMVIRALISYSIWSAVFATQIHVGFYTKTQMFTYLSIGYLISAVVLSSCVQELGDDIQSGKLSNALLKPQPYSFFLFGRELGDKLINVLFAGIELGFLYAVFRPQLEFAQDVRFYILFVVALFGALLLYMLINTALSLLAFWTNEVWASRFVFFIFLEFLSGWIVPVDVFPSPVQEIVLLTPFPYLLFFPARIFSGNIHAPMLVQGFAVVTMWCIAMLMLCYGIWRRGIIRYTADGR